MKYNAGQHLHDEIASYFWTLISAAEGYETAKMNIRYKESGLTEYQITEGQKIAEEFNKNKDANFSLLLP